MKALRSLGFAFWLALALVAGQQVALLHDLAHATETLAQKQDSKPAQTKCEKCFACAQLIGAAPTIFAVPPVVCETAVLAVADNGALPARAPAYRSQAPPALL